MIDTIKVFTDDFRVRDAAALAIQPAIVDYQSGVQDKRKLFRNSAGEWVEGAKAYLNTDSYNLTLKPDNAGDGVKLFLQWSLPKAFTGDNFYPLSADQLGDAKRALEHSLSDKGVMLELDECKVSRVDTFQNVYSAESFADYATLFRLLRAKRQQRRDYGTTFLWANTQREICVYDKVAEIKSRGGSYKAYPENTIRFEYRLKNSRVTERELGLGKLKDLQNFDGVKAAYKQAMEKNLFSLKVDEVNVLISSRLEAVIRAYYESGGRYWLRNFISEFGAYMLLRSIEPENLQAVIERVSGYRMTGWRAVRDLEKSRDKLALHLEGVGEKTLADLYAELRDKVLSETF